jgi:hypothetical protein
MHRVLRSEFPYVRPSHEVRVFTWSTLRRIIEPVRLHSADYSEHRNLKTAACRWERSMTLAIVSTQRRLSLSLRVVLVQKQTDASRLPNWTACVTAPHCANPNRCAPSSTAPTESWTYVGISTCCH